MRLSLAWLAIVLLALSVAAPVAEAFEDCRVECTSGPGDDCGTTECCSCCPAARFIATTVRASVRTPDPTTESVVVVARVPRDAEPRGILHVPKALAL